jgi:2-dehydro-3-deoxyphosphogluconate aldolase/(4S)-4-hydroxy-2-oxoglutarate aldolase
VYRWEAMQVLTAQRIIGIVRTPAGPAAVSTAIGMLRAGLRTLEIALTTPGGLDAIRAVRAEAPPGALIGAGTVLDEATARAAVDAGAGFLVAPNLEPAVICAGHRYGVPVIPGAATATEVVRALDLGADAVKIFPASQHGPRWLSDLRAALPQAPLVPTGGVTPATAPEWVAAGAVACGMGASLTSGGPQAAAERVTALLSVLTGGPERDAQ